MHRMRAAAVQTVAALFLLHSPDWMKKWIIDYIQSVIFYYMLFSAASWAITDFKKS